MEQEGVVCVAEGQAEVPDGVKPPLPAWARRKGSALLHKARGKLFSTCCAEDKVFKGVKLQPV